MDSELSTAEALEQIKKVSEELRLLRQSRANLAGRRDPVSVRNVKQLSVGIRRKFDEHNALRELLISRGEISGD